jgi:magnesium transporter
LTLGGIGFLRAAVTPEDVRGGTKEYPDKLQILVPKGSELTQKDDRTYGLPPHSIELTPTRLSDVTLPRGGEAPQRVTGTDSDHAIYEFPANCEIRYRPVGRWQLSLVIACAVAGICLWGTLVGSMLPIIFKRIGVDPGIASSPFVATFVDVTGIMIYFNIARIILPELAGIQ